MGDVLFPGKALPIGKILCKRKPEQWILFFSQLNVTLQFSHKHFQYKSLMIIGDIHQTEQSNLLLRDSCFLLQFAVSRVFGCFSLFHLAADKIKTPGKRIFPASAEKDLVLCLIENNNAVHVEEAVNFLHLSCCPFIRFDHVNHCRTVPFVSYLPSVSLCFSPVNTYSYQLRH